MNHVPYKGLAPALQDMIGGQIDSVFGALSVIQPMAAAGRIKVVAVSGAQRVRIMPQVPTFAEAGVKDYEVGFFMGLAAAAKTPVAIIEQIAADVRNVARSASFREKNADPFAFETVADSPAEFAAWLVKNREVQANLVKISGAKLD
jgi:tripartite-type tricarboxylate transporter receptor subunit TctC